MAKAKKQPINEKLAAVLETAKPANPTLSSADKVHLRGLKKRGFTDAEIIQLAAKAGFVITAETLAVKPRKPKTGAIPASAKAAAQAAETSLMQRTLNAVTR